MSFVTFVRDYIQDPDKIVHIPSFIFDVCREFLWYIFSFQWLRNLAYVTLSLAYPEGLSSDSGTFYSSLLENVAKTQNNGIVQQNPSSLSEGVFSTPLSTTVGDFLASSGLPERLFSIPNINNSVLNPLSFAYGNPTELSSSMTALLTNSAFTPLGYGFFNGIISNFHFCAITIVIAHIILNENKNRAFKIAAISCFADLSCTVAVLLGFRRLIIPWSAAEPLGYFLGFAIQFYFALEIIKDNRRIKSLDSKDGKKNTTIPGVRPAQVSKTLGRLSYNYWLIPSIVLFSWCEQTQFFQTLATNSFQPTATLMGLPFFNGNNSFSSWQSNSNLSTILASKTTLPSASGDVGGESISSLWSNIAFGSPLSKERELQILAYLLTYIIVRIAFTWIGLSMFQKVIDWKNNNYFKPLNWIYSECKFLIRRVVNTIKKLVGSGDQTSGESGNTFTYSSPLSFFLSFAKGDPKAIQRRSKGDGKERNPSIIDGQYSSTLAPPKKIQHILRDPLAIAAVTCSFAFLPSYSTNLLLTKSVGFFPEENRIKHSFFSPWDMPAEVLASDMDFISSHHNLAEYPFFLPFYDKGEYGGWLGVGEEDIRYGPFKLWQTRRIRAPWRRTTLQEPALTYANDKSLFVNPNPNPRKEESTSITFGQPLVSSPLQESSTRLSLPLQNKLLLSPYLEEVKQKDLKSKVSSYALLTPSPKDKKGYARGKKETVNENTKNQKESINFPESGGASSLPIPLVAAPAQDNLLNSTFDSGDTKDFSEVFLWRTPIAESSFTNNAFATITKNGRKRLIEGFKKPVRKMSTSKLFNLSSFSPFAVPHETEGNKGIGKGDAPYIELAPGKMQEGVEGYKVQEFSKSSLLLKGVQGFRRDETNSEFGKSQQKSFIPKVSRINYKIGEFINILSERVAEKFGNQEVEIKNTKQIRKRFKKFKKRVRLFRSKSYKKRNTKIRRLKHFHYLRNKKKKRRKSRRLIYKLRRQFPYMRNIKERKAEIFGFYSPVISSFWAPYSFPSTTNKEDLQNQLPNLNRGVLSSNSEGEGYGTGNDKLDKNYSSNQNPFAFSYAPDIEGKVYGVRDKSKIQNINNEKSSYDRGYPKDKNSRNSKKDFNLIFRTQIGERLDFAQEEIRARIFMNPYIRFLLNKRIDNFFSREKVDFVSSTPPAAFAAQTSSSLPYTKGKVSQEVKSKAQSQSSFLPSISLALNTGDKKNLKNLVQSAKLTADAEEKLFKRRLIISKYADAVDFLKPNSRHSYVDRIYNHQFKGTLSTARRLFSLKVQYDQPLVHSKNYEPVLEHEGFRGEGKQQITIPSSAFGDAKTLTSKPQAKFSQDSQLLKIKGEDKPKKEADEVSFVPKSSQNHKMIAEGVGEYDQGTLLEKSSTAPFYAAWDSELRKLVFTNRYLNHKLATKGMEQISPSVTFGRLPQESIEDAHPMHSLYPEKVIACPKGNGSPYTELAPGKAKESKDKKVKQKNHHQQFTSWPLRESYFKDNEFLVSQLYSNSQPIDSFLSQENEKARPVTLPRRVSSFNTILSYKNSVPPTDAQRSQQIFKIENNDRKTFLFKHLWTSSNTAVSFKGEPSLSDNKNKYKLPTSAEQRKITRMEEREYPLWMVLRTLAPNQGGFLWPGD